MPPSQVRERQSPPQALAVGRESRIARFFLFSFAEKLLDLPRIFEVESRLVAIQSFSDAVITNHAAVQMRRREIDVADVRAILHDPEQVLEVRPGRVVLQSRVMVDNRSQLVRLFVDVDESPVRVVTVYRTSKIDKYWSR